MQKKLIILIFIIILPITIKSQNIKRIYKFLEKADYTKAKEILDKFIIEQPDNSITFFAYMILYGDKTSSFYNPLEAYYYSRKLLERIENLSKEEYDIISEYFTNTEVIKSSLPVKKKILHAIGTIEADMIKYLREENNIDLVNQAIERFPDFKYYNNLIHIRNQFEFRKYEKMMTLEGFEEFLKKYPQAAQKDKAIKYRNKLAFEKAMKINTEEAFNEFINKYPDADEYYEAIKMRNKLAFEKAKRLNTLEAMEAFKQKYPDAIEIGEANIRIQKLLYEKAKTIQSLELFNEFITKYPDGVYYVDIFNLKSKSLGEKYCQRFFDGTIPIIWCRGFDKSNDFEIPGSIIVTMNNEYIVVVNSKNDSSKYFDGWILKINNDGKMIWNTYVGELYNDSIYEIVENKNNEYIMLAKTQVYSTNNSYHPWLFKINDEKKKIWSRNLGNWYVKNVVVNSFNEIILGGYVIDSFNIYPRLLCLNNNGKKIWERTFSINGTINGIQLLDDNTILVASGKWLSLIDSKGYILWEKDNIDSIQCLIPVKKNLTLLVSKSDSINYVLTLLDVKNGVKTLWKKSIGLGTKSIFKNFYYDNSYFYVNLFNDKDILIKFDNYGNAIKTIEFPAQLQLFDFKIDNSNNIIMGFSINGDILLTKNLSF